VNLALAASVAATGFAVAFLHAALPTHWLPFVLVGRGRGWSTSRTLGVAALAGLGHVVLTIGLGLAVVGAGVALEDRLGHVFAPAAGGLTAALGVWYMLRKPHAHGPARTRYGSDRAAVAGLVALLSLSPCEAFLPLYLANIGHGWLMFGLLSLVLLAATAAGMLLFTALSLAGVSRLNLSGLERHESKILGAVLIAVGVAVAAFEV
jgi:nickel/cobalt transporter (NicO) family protein